MGGHALGELGQAIGGGAWSFPLARGDYQMLVVPEPPVLESEMESSLRWTLGGMVDFPIDEAVIEWMRIPTGIEPNREKQLYVIVARQSVVQEQAALFATARLALKAMDVRETALRNVAALLERKNEGIGLLTLGTQGVTTTFTYRGELYLDRFIAQPAEDVVDGARLPRFLDRLAQQVYQSLDLLGRNFPFIHVGRIVVAPSPDAATTAAHLKAKLPVPVEAMDLAAVVDISRVPELRNVGNQAQYLLALGTALRGQGAFA